ncbi:MAG: DUF6909 family protein [Candidatus Dormibacteria bacterium]
MPAAPGREEVELYTRTFLTILRSSGEVRLRVLERVHLGMHSSLHPMGAEELLDTGALLYSLHRLPPVTLELEHVLMGQSPEQLLRTGSLGGAAWEVVAAPGRRRRWWWDAASKTLAVALASSSDLDDLVPTLVALQIEWNKAHRRLRAGDSGAINLEFARECLGIGHDDWQRLLALFGPRMEEFLATVGRRQLDLKLRLIGGSQVGYARATREWWGPVGEILGREGLRERPVYFISSNAHCLVNLLSGVARERAEHVLRWAEGSSDAELRELVRLRRRSDSNVSPENFLYYAARLWFDAHPRARQGRTQEEQEEGIFHVEARSGTDVAAQIIVLDRLRVEAIDPRLGLAAAADLRSAPQVLINIQYPLGLGAYHILRQVMEATDRVEGVYILGKAATLNADVGDVLISDVVHDEHSGNTYWLDNCFSFADVAPFVTSRSVLDRQRAVSVRSSFLQNRAYLDFYYRGAYTVVEMEAGPYLGAVFEAGDPSRYPTDEQVDLTRPAMEVGLIHYASDTPYTQARTLGARGLRFEGMEATYAGALAIASRVLQRAGVLPAPARS